MNTYRCSCCGRTNNRMLALTSEEYTNKSFYDDPDGKYPWDKICEECVDVVEDTIEEWNNDESKD